MYLVFARSSNDSYTHTHTHIHERTHAHTRTHTHPLSLSLSLSSSSTTEHWNQSHLGFGGYVLDMLHSPSSMSTHKTLESSSLCRALLEVAFCSLPVLVHWTQTRFYSHSPWSSTPIMRTSLHFQAGFTPLVESVKDENKVVDANSQRCLLL